MIATRKTYHTTAEAARMLGLHPSKLTRLLRGGDLGEAGEVGRLGNRRVLSPEDVERIRSKLASKR